MENKFQEALYIVNERFDYMNEELHPNKHYQKPQFSLDTLQQAIDDLEFYKKALDKTIDLLYGDKSSIIPIDKGIYKIKILEKAKEELND